MLPENNFPSCNFWGADGKVTLKLLNSDSLRHLGVSPHSRVTVELLLDILFSCPAPGLALGKGGGVPECLAA